MPTFLPYDADDTPKTRLFPCAACRRLQAPNVKEQAAAAGGAVSWEDRQ
ncbi:hypothetical protein BBSC_1322 [Bifidobacterium scardovii JCM 12489 = DSM 13734]|nr:hypothetical protein BBSC_1322 [Bifidobacterium scardovii JCM 12489 = DSM 13734]